MEGSTVVFWVDTTYVVLGALVKVVSVLVAVLVYTVEVVVFVVVDETVVV